MQSKAFWQSKTFWFNVIFLVVTAAGPVLDYFGWAEFEPSPEIVVIGGVLVTVINLVLRYFFTQQPLSLKRPE